jgi:hypothetical protein
MSKLVVPACCLAAAVMGLWSADAAAAPTYRLTILGLMPKTGWMNNAYINADGTVAGNAGLKSDPKVIDTHMFRAVGGTPEIAAAPDAKATTTAANIDSMGRVAGTLSKPGWPDRVVVWGGADRGEVIATGTARGGNGRGDVVGFVKRKPRLWTLEGRTVTVTADFIESDDWPLVVNDAGVVAGTTFTDDRHQAAIWTEGGGTQLIDPVPGQPQALTFAHGINAGGEVVGHAYTLGAPSAPMRWTAIDGVELLPALDGCGAPTALASNASGTIVGGCTSIDSVRLRNGGAWIWTRAGGLRTLFDVTDPADPRRRQMEFWEASGINDRGQIVGSGFYKDKNWRVTFVLDPIEEAR